MKSTIRVILPAKEVPSGVVVARLNTSEVNVDKNGEFTVENQAMLNGAMMQLPETELCLTSKSPGKASHIVSPETEVIAHLSLEQVRSLMA